MDCDEDDDNDYNNNDDNGDGDDEHDNDGSLSGSDDNEKSCSWNGSNNGNESINGNDSINGDTSGDARSSGSNSRSDGSSTHNSNSSSSSSSSNDSNNIGSGSSGSNSHNSGSGSGSGSGSDSPVPKHAKKDWKEKEERGFEKGFNYGTKPPNTKPPGVYKAQHTQHADNRQHTQHANAYPTHIPTHISTTHSDVAASQSMESYNHGGVAPGHTDYSAPNPSMIVLEIKATLAAADYYKSQSAAPPQWSYPQTHPAHPAPVPAQETYSLSIGPHLSVPYHTHASHPTTPMHTMQATLHPLVHPLALTHPLALHPIHPTHATHGSHGNHKNQIHPTKVKNILLSVIPPGISAPRGPGGTSPQGLFTPVPTILSSSYPNSQTIHRQQLSQLQQLSGHKNNGLGGTTPHRNLPSSNSNVPEPL